jgi:hypothetical protein
MVNVQVAPTASDVLAVQSPVPALLSGKSAGKLTAEKVSG